MKNQENVNVEIKLLLIFVIDIDFTNLTQCEMVVLIYLQGECIITMFHSIFRKTFLYFIFLQYQGFSQ